MRNVIIAPGTCTNLATGSYGWSNLPTSATTAPTTSITCIAFGATPPHCCPHSCPHCPQADALTVMAACYLHDLVNLPKTILPAMMQTAAGRTLAAERLVGLSAFRAAFAAEWLPQVQ